MSFVEDIYDAIVDVLESVVDTIVELVEDVYDAIVGLLGFNDDQIIEYYDVRNIQLFDKVDSHNALLHTVSRSILTNSDIAGDLIYATTFRSLKGDLRKFLAYIEGGNYFEGFPQVESYIISIDYAELTDTLTLINGEPCTPEQSSLTALTDRVWVQYWLQENKEYNVGTGILENGSGSIQSTFPGTPVSSFDVQVNGTDIQITITDEAATSDVVIIDAVWEVDLSTIVYNDIADNYTVTVFNSLGVIVELPYTIPTKPLQIHYVSYYYRDSAPARQYLFIYQAGEGTYPTLDDPETPIDIDGATLHAIPAIPLRISNVSYTSLPAAKQLQIEELCELVSLDAEALLDAVMDDPDAKPGDIDNMYINFGIRMWDTSQTGMAYLFNMFQNLFPAQAVTKGIYDDSPPQDTKPQNNIIITTGDYKYLFQFSYISFEHFTVAEIDADSGSVENGIYYSDMSRFNSSGDLVYSYFVSSGKGTYNVGYKADDLDEVTLFLAGNGVVNPGDTTTEGVDWMQPTTRLRYTDPLQNADGAASELRYLTPDMVYTNAAGTLRLVNRAAEITTSGQAIIYYHCTPSGLDAYTVKAPIGSLRVEDGDTGHFRMVKFNLGSRKNMMVPFIHDFIADLSNRDVTQLFLAGTHMSIYIAHYEVIEASGWGLLLMIVIIVIIIVVAIYTGYIIDPSTLLAAETTATGVTSVGTAIYAAPVTVSATGITTVIATGELVTIGTLSSAAALTGIVSTAGIAGGIAGTLAVAWAPTFVGWAAQLLVSQLIKYAVTEIAEDNPELAAVLGVVAAVASGSFNTSTMRFQMPSLTDMAKVFNTSTDYINLVVSVHVENELDELKQDEKIWREDLTTRENLLEGMHQDLFRSAAGEALALTGSSIRSSINPMLPEDYLVLNNNKIEAQYLPYDFDANINFGVTVATFT